MLDPGDFAEFRAMIKDLCIWGNVPFNNDRLRLFWEALKDEPLVNFRRKVQAWKQSAKAFPKSPNELKSETQSFEPQRRPASKHLSVGEQTALGYTFMLKKFPKLTLRQKTATWEWKFRKVEEVAEDGSKIYRPQLVAVTVPADGEAPELYYKFERKSDRQRPTSERAVA